MACYLGDKSTVLSMIQEDNVHPNIADMQGNTALMYATVRNFDNLNCSIHIIFHLFS